MNKKAVSRYCKSTVSVLLITFVLAFGSVTSDEPHEPDPAMEINFALAFDDLAPYADEGGSDAETQLSEEEADEGQDFSSLFEEFVGENSVMRIDTSFAWHNYQINSGRFDYKTFGSEDTVRIQLVDSEQGKLFAHPFPNYITSRFGPRRYTWHYGTDIKLQVGDTVRCAFDGIVRAVQYERRGYGNVAVVRHHNGLETLYAHLQRVTVRPNQPLKAGDVVGLGGNTGRSTGAHLHFEIRYHGEPFSPEYVMEFSNDYALKSDTLILTRSNFEYLTEVRKTVTHTIKRGETLGAIAKRYGTSVNALCRLNGITTKTTLSVGRRLVIRSGKEAERQVVTSVAPVAAASSAQTDPPIDTLVDEGADTGGPDESADDLLVNLANDAAGIVNNAGEGEINTAID